MKDEDPPIRLGELLRWIEERQLNKTLTPCDKNDIFDLGQTISDDIKTGTLRNGFIIYDNGGKIRIISIFQDQSKISPLSRQLIIELITYLTRINPPR